MISSSTPNGAGHQSFRPGEKGCYFWQSWPQQSDETATSTSGESENIIIFTHSSQKKDTDSGEKEFITLDVLITNEWLAAHNGEWVLRSDWHFIFF